MVAPQDGPADTPRPAASAAGQGEAAARHRRARPVHALPPGSIYATGLDPGATEPVPLSPVGALAAAALAHPGRVAVWHEEGAATYAELAARCSRLASALAARGIGPGDTVSTVLPNVPSALEAHFGVPGCGAVLNPVNTRLDAASVAYILRHGEARAVVAQADTVGVVREALARLDGPGRPLLVGDGCDGDLPYEALLAEGDPDAPLGGPADERQPLALSYTSGTTGDPKGVVLHHRGAYLNAAGGALAWGMPRVPVYLWTLPMFHALGWCFQYAVTMLAGTHVCLRRVEPRAVYAAIAGRGVTHLCCAPVVLTMLLADPPARPLARPVRVLTGGAPPPPEVIRRAESLGFDVTHAYGLTECFGPSMVREPGDGWRDLPLAERAALMARQGHAYPSVEAVRVADRDTGAELPWDGESLGEVEQRSNTTMLGYLKDREATRAAIRDGAWLRTGDLAVRHPDGSVQVRDRAKDIVITGGENVSTVEVEAAIHDHPAVLEAAVVAKPDPKWGETPLAFVALRAGASATEAEIVAHCRARLAGFKVPRGVVFLDEGLPKTSTGKIQKFALRDRARAMASGRG